MPKSDDKENVADRRILAARALNPFLDPFHSVNGELLRSVSKLYVHGCLDTIGLQFDHLSLLIAADPESDTIEVIAGRTDTIPSDTYVDASNSPLWRKFIGEAFGWGWLTMNQQGRCDGVLLSFRGIRPQLLLMVIASSLKESAVEESSDFRS